MHAPLRIVFLGTPDFAAASLKRLVGSGYNIVAVVTAPDKPAGRGLKMQESAVKQYAVEAGLKVMQPERLKDEVFVREFRALEADLGVVIAFRMLPEVVWDAPRLGTINLHASLLPHYRGAAPINWAIINGETTTGLTIFSLNHEIDKGDILMRREVVITPDDTAGTLHDKLMEIGADLVPQAIDMIAEGRVKPESQLHFDEAELKPAPKIFKDDCRIDWRRTAKEVHDFVRGLSPYPGAWTEMIGPGGEVTAVKIFSVHILQATTGNIPGMIGPGPEGLTISCGNGAVMADELQAAGKKRMPAADFLRGLRDPGTYHFRY